MRENYDFSDAVSNPFAGREKGKYVVKVHYDFTKNMDMKSEQVHVHETYSQTKVQTEK